MDTATIRRIGAPAAAAALLLAVTLALPGCTTKVVATGATPQEAITAAGTGVALSKPDRADVTFSVSSSAADPKTAMTKAAVVSDRVTKALKAAGIADKELQTTGVTLSPKYTYKNGASLVAGYQANVEVRARVNDIAKVGDVIVAGTGAGATSVSGPSFSLTDANPAKFEARSEAVADAKAKATVLAKASGRSLGAVQSVTEAGAVAANNLMRDGALPSAVNAGTAAYAPDIQAGQLEDRSSVTVVFGLK